MGDRSFGLLARDLQGRKRSLYHVHELPYDNLCLEPRSSRGLEQVTTNNEFGSPADPIENGDADTKMRDSWRQHDVSVGRLSNPN